RPVALADLAEGLAAVARDQQQPAGLVLERQHELPVRVAPVQRAPIDVGGFAAHELPGGARVRAEPHRLAVDQRQQEGLAGADRVERHAAGPFRAALEDLLTDALPGLALVGRAEDPAVAEVDVDVARLAVDGDAAQPAEARLLLAEQLRGRWLPLLRRR